MLIPSATYSHMAMVSKLTLRVGCSIRMEVIPSEIGGPEEESEYGGRSFKVGSDSVCSETPDWVTLGFGM